MNNLEYQRYNCIMVYNEDKTKLLFCKRTCDPYMGKYNFVGGKVNKDENEFDGAYRELFEETGIGRDDIILSYMMDFTYHNQNCIVSVFAGILINDVSVIPEKHPLYWLDSDRNDFFDSEIFAGEGNIGHMVMQIKEYGFGYSNRVEIKRIDESDYGCEEKLDSRVYDIVTLVFNGNIEKYSILDDLLIKNNINEGMIITRKQLEELQEG